MERKVYFVGAGPGNPKLITVLGREMLEKADLVMYAGSLVNPEVLNYTKGETVDSYGLTLDETTKIIADAVGSPMDEFKVAFEGVRVYDLKGNQEAFQGEFLKTFTEVGQIMADLNPKEIKTVPTPQEALAIDHIKELAGK